MIIGYYPGAGGNRLFQYLGDNDYSQHKIAYDTLTNNNLIPVRGAYLIDSSQITLIKSKSALLHCVNYDLISQKIDVHNQQVFIIKSDLKQSLRREWALKGKFKPMCHINSDDFLLDLYKSIRDPSWPVIYSIDDYHKLPSRITKEVDEEFEKNSKSMNTDHTHNFLNAAYTSIAWHIDVYDRYPLNPGPANLIDIDNDQTEFAKFMRKELSLFSDHTLFNFAWDVFEQHGPDANIIDLYHERYPHAK